MLPVHLSAALATVQMAFQSRTVQAERIILPLLSPVALLAPLNKEHAQTDP